MISDHSTLPHQVTSQCPVLWVGSCDVGDALCNVVRVFKLSEQIVKILKPLVLASVHIETNRKPDERTHMHNIGKQLYPLISISTGIIGIRLCTIQKTVGLIITLNLHIHIVSYCNHNIIIITLQYPFSLGSQLTINTSSNIKHHLSRGIQNLSEISPTRSL